MLNKTIFSALTLTLILSFTAQAQSVIQVSASSHDGHPPTAVLDGSFEPESRWSAEGDGAWIQFDFGSAETVTAIDIAFHHGDIRFQYFDIETLDNAGHWQSQYSGSSSGNELGFQRFAIPSSTTQMVRIVGHGNSISEWNSLTEVDFVFDNTSAITVTASDHDGHGPENTLDNSLDGESRWSALGNGAWIQYDMNEVTTISGVDIAFYRGDSRIQYFDIDVAEQAGHWNQVYSGSSSGDSLQFQSFNFEPIDTRLVRITGHGNTSNNWNSLTEVQITESSSSPPTPEPPTPEPPPPPPPPTNPSGYRGIPEPSDVLGFDVWADYPASQVVTGSQGDRTLTCNGTAQTPCLIDATNATFSKLTISGSYVIVQGGQVNAPASSGAFVRVCSYCVVRDITLSGPGTDQSHSSAVGMSEHSVWIRGKVHGFGDNRTEAREQDFHGFKVMSDFVWILDAEVYDMSGDSVQVGDASRGAAANVYIGGGYFHDNRENGVDIKDSTNIVVSGNTLEGFSPTSSDPGSAIVVHDDAFDAKFYDNVIYNTHIGIVSSGEAGHIIDANIVEALTTGIQLRNTRDIVVSNNTISAPTPIEVQGGVTGDIQDH